MEKELKRQLKLYDKVVAAERKRLIAGYKKYGKKYQEENLVTEAIEEILDLFGYLMLMKMKKEDIWRSW